MHGWMGRRLRIDLSRARFDIETLSPDYCRRWIGGRGFNADVLYHETPPGLAPFASENRLCFAAAALTGTLAPASGLTYVAARSPQTCSVMGELVTGIGAGTSAGGFGPMMKYAGYDQIVVTGRAVTPVYVLVNEDAVEFREASHVWALGTRAAAIRILEELGDSNIELALIGPAGENRVRIAGVVEAGHLAAESAGTGAVMGSKQLKALAVMGKKPVMVAAPKTFMSACWEIRDNLRQICSSAVKRAPGDRPPDARAEQGRLSLRQNACWSCPVGCEGLATVKEGPFVGFQGFAPAPQAVARLGTWDVFKNAACLPVIVDTLRDLGMDMVSAAVAVSWIWEAWEKGIVTENDLGCSLLDREDPKSNLELLYRIGLRQGVGDRLADGVNLHAYAASRGFPVEDLLDCSRLQADHVNRKRRLSNERARMQCVADISGICGRDFADTIRAEVLVQTVVQLLRPCTGIDLAGDEINAAADRTLSLERAIWLRQGSARQDDSQLARHWRIPFAVGNFPPLTQDRGPDESVQDMYYLEQGWDVEGFIIPQKAAGLKLPEIIPDMETGRNAYRNWLAQSGCTETGQ